MNSTDEDIWQIIKLERQPHSFGRVRPKPTLEQLDKQPLDWSRPAIVPDRLLQPRERKY